MKILTGIVHGKSIELNEHPDVSDGAEVTVVIHSSSRQTAPGNGFLRTEGALAGDSEWDVIMEEIQRNRRHERESADETP